MPERPPKIVITKIGLDGHDRGSRIVATHLRDAGMEVLYTPPWQPIAGVVKLAIEEDADVIGISSLATDHLLVPKLIAALREAGAAEVQVVVGGIVPPGDEPRLLEAGVARVFHPGAPLGEIATAVRALAAKARAARREASS
jgi:methylmalonyl-CoA mutase C-terminal domain/subunit